MALVSTDHTRKLISYLPLLPNRDNNSIFSELIKSIKHSSKKTKNSLFKNKICVHIKINTGMNRWGFLPANLPKLILKLKNIKGLTIGSIYSHLASAENEVDDAFTKSQISTLEKVKTMFSEAAECSRGTLIKSVVYLSFWSPYGQNVVKFIEKH